MTVVASGLPISEHGGGDAVQVVLDGNPVTVDTLRAVSWADLPALVDLRLARTKLTSASELTSLRGCSSLKVSVRPIETVP